MVEFVDIRTRNEIQVVNTPTPGCITLVELLDRSLWRHVFNLGGMDVFHSAICGVMWKAGNRKVVPAAVVIRADDALQTWVDLQPGDYHTKIESGDVIPWFDFVDWLSDVEKCDRSCLVGILTHNGNILT